MDVGALGLYICLFLALYFEVFLLISFFEQPPKGRTTTLPKRYPSVSVVVPCYNEEATLGATIESLLALEYPKDKLEVIVVDDGSRDNTRKIGERYAATNNRVKFFHKTNGGKYTALNFGIAQSSAEVVGCLDADSFVAPDALIEAAKRFDEPGVMAITPAMKVHRPRNALELMQAVEYTFGIFYKKMFDNLSAINVLPGPFSLYRREIFAKIGPFRHAHNTEDMEIAFRMHAHGLKIVNAHTSVVYTTVPRTVMSLVRQRTRWSQGFLQNSRDYSYMYFNRRFGNFGIVALPFGLLAFASGLYAAGFTVYRIATFVLQRLSDLSGTGIPLYVPKMPEVTWFYVNTDMMMFVVAAVLAMTLVAIFLGSRIAQTRLSLKAFASYFMFFGLIAPLWLARAAWGAVLARESVWR